MKTTTIISTTAIISGSVGVTEIHWQISRGKERSGKFLASGKILETTWKVEYHRLIKENT